MNITFRFFFNLFHVTKSVSRSRKPEIFRGFLQTLHTNAGGVPYINNDRSHRLTATSNSLLTGDSTLGIIYTTESVFQQTINTFYLLILAFLSYNFINWQRMVKWIINREECRKTRPSFTMRSISENLQVNSKQNSLGRYFKQGAHENDMLRSDNISTVVRCSETIQ